MAFVDVYLSPLTGDIDLTGSRMRLTSSMEEVIRQKVFITLRTFKGEYFANTEFGVPYLENETNPIQLFGTSSKALFDSTIKASILAVEGVSQVVSYNSEFNRSTGVIEIFFRATIQSGEVISPVAPITFQI